MVAMLDRVRVFDVIGDVLPVLFAQVPGDNEDERSSIVRKRLDDLQEAYSRLQVGPDISYKDLAAQVGYLQRHAPAHAYEIYRLIRDQEELRGLFSHRTLKVACIGGGPGTDIIGLAKYVTSKARRTALSCRIFDLEPAWVQSWHEIEQRLLRCDSLSLSCEYSAPFDVTKASSWKGYMPRVVDSDLVTIVYCAGELVTRQRSTSEFLINLLRQIDPGTIVLFVDNCSGSCRDWVIDVAKRCNVQMIAPASNVRATAGDDEDEDRLGAFRFKWGHPKSRPHSDWRVFIKK